MVKIENTHFFDLGNQLILGSRGKAPGSDAKRRKESYFRATRSAAPSNPRRISRPPAQPRRRAAYCIGNHLISSISAPTNTKEPPRRFVCHDLLPALCVVHARTPQYIRNTPTAVHATAPLGMAKRPETASRIISAPSKSTTNSLTSAKSCIGGVRLLRDSWLNGAALSRRQMPRAIRSGWGIRRMHDLSRRMLKSAVRG